MRKAIILAVLLLPIKASALEITKGTTRTPASPSLQNPATGPFNIPYAILNSSSINMTNLLNDDSRAGSVITYKAGPTRKVVIFSDDVSNSFTFGETGLNLIIANNGQFVNNMQVGGLSSYASGFLGPVMRPYTTQAHSADSGGGTRVPLTVAGASAQTANLLEWINFSNKLLSYVTATGSITILSGAGLSVGTTNFFVNPEGGISVGVQASSPEYIAVFSTNTGWFNFGVSTRGYVSTRGALPNLTSCGTSTMADGSDIMGGSVNVVGVVTACTINWPNPSNKTTYCTVTDNNTAIAAVITAQSRDAITVSFGASLGGGFFNYSCSVKN